MTFKFASVDDYFDSIKELDLTYPQYNGDFLPYIELESGTYDHWVGYYSSTPVLKQMIRDLFQKLRSVKFQLMAALGKDLRTGDGHLMDDLKEFLDDIKKIEEDASIMTHHDAITSTSPLRTLEDYMRRIRISLKDIESIE